ncbi:MAG: T9SS type A sorting domain-containing protein [Bacteroidota bacterium]|nr:T9SS type A sorting domain-containing protein [Bacteroidota bacterium]
MKKGTRMKKLNLLLYFLLLTINANGNGLDDKNISMENSGPPIIREYYAKAITTTSAVLWAHFSPNGSKLFVWFEWGTTASYGNTTVIAEFEDAQYAGPSYYKLNELIPNTIYHFRVVAENIFGRTTSEDRTFITMPPTVITLPIDSFATTSARLMGRINPNGQPTSAYFMWKAVDEFNWLFTPVQNISAGVTNVEISSSIDRLIPDVSYFVRAVAYNSDMSDVIKIGNLQTFTTLIDPNSGGFAISIQMKDSTGYPTHAQRKFGLHTHASYCIDEALGEFFLPPMPPTDAAEGRFIDPRTGYSACMDQGMYLDLRKYENPTQVDTYKYKFQIGSFAYPINFVWQDLNANYSGAVRLLFPLNGSVFNINMKQQTSFTLTEEDINLFYIIAEGPRNNIWAKVNTVSQNSAVLVGKFNPNGFPTEGWFEWGITKIYDKITTKQDLGNIYNPIFYSEALDSIQPNVTYYFRAVAKNQLGTLFGIDQMFTISPEVSVKEKELLPKSFILEQNYPNPFNPTTNIKFSIPVKSHVDIRIFDVLGRVVTTLLNESKDAGNFEVEFNGTSLANGIYFYKIKAVGVNEPSKTFVQVRKMLLIK